MDNLKLFRKNKDHIDTPVNTVHLLNKDITVGYGFKACSILIFKRVNIYHCEGITLLDKQIMREVEKDGYKYLGMVELDRMGSRSNR